MLLQELRGVSTGLAMLATALLFGASVEVGLPGQGLLTLFALHITGICAALTVIMLLLGAWRRGVALALVIVAGLFFALYPLYKQAEVRRQAEAAIGPPSAASPLLAIRLEHGGGDVQIGALAKTTADLLVVTDAGNLDLSNVGDIAFADATGCEADQVCDLLLLSRTPLFAVRVLEFGPQNRHRLIMAKTRVGEQTVTIVAVDINPPYYDAFPVIEFGELRRLVRNLDGPVVVVGGFSAAPWSAPMVDLMAKAKLVPAPTTSATWPASWGGLGVPTDSVLTRGDAIVQSLSTLPSDLSSTHASVLALVRLAVSR